MVATDNRQIVEKARESWNAGNLDGYLSMYADNCVLRGYAGVEPGKQSIRKFYEGFWAAFPKSKLIFEDVLADGDKVTIRFVVEGIHNGDFNGIPATGKSFQTPGITILRFAGSKCVERWSQADMLGLLQQLGVMPG